MHESSLFQKNLVFLDSAFPALASLARRSTDMLTRPVIDEGGVAHDIDLGGGCLYNRPVTEFAREQVAAWRRAPMRVVVNEPFAETLLDPCTKGVTTRLAEEAGGDLLAEPPRDQAGMLVVIGLGLGAHVPVLLEELTPRHLVLVEPIEEFAAHSLHALDWSALAARCRDIGASLDIVLQGDPRAVQKDLEGLMSGFGASSVDGAYTFVHYQTDVTRAIARGFQELAGMKSIMQGYFADERLMIENTVANVNTHDFWLVDGAFQAPHDLPAFIVGSGPSLDRCFDTIREWAGHAVIFSAGSALQGLLNAGIRPDFHVEKENSPLTETRMHHIFERTGRQGETFGVNLMASTTVKPGVSALFDDKFLFHREQLSSTRMFGRGHNPVVGTGPFSANTAVSLATVLGFRRMYFFGCDCGSVDQGVHHAADTVYNTREGHATAHDKMPVPVAANFGGQAWSNSYYLWSRWVFETMIAGAGITAFNCSDGVRIEGAAPVRPADLEMPGKGLDKVTVLRAVKDMCRHYGAGTYLDEQDVPGAVRGWHAFAGEVRGFLDTELTAAKDIYTFELALIRFLDGADKRHGGVVVPLAGSARSMVPVAGYYLNRAPDDGACARLFDAFRVEFRARIEDLLSEGDEVFDAILPAVDATQELRAAG